MENNHETLRMSELKALTREHGLRNYSRLRKAELIAFLWDNEPRAQRRQRPPQMSTWEPNQPPQMSTWEPNRPPQRHPRMSTWEPEHEQENEAKQSELEAPLTKRQLKHRRNKDSKLAKKFKKFGGREQ